MKTIYIITSSFPPSSIVGSLRPFRLAKYLAGSGWKVEVITKRPDANYSHNNELLKDIKSNINIHYLPSIKVLKKSNNSDKKNKSLFFDAHNLLTRIFGTITDILNSFLIPDIEILSTPAYFFKLFQIYKSSHHAVILTTSPPHSIHFAGFLFSKIKKIPWAADFRDPWDYYPKTGHIEMPNPIERFLERLIIENADAVISTTQTYNEDLKIKHHELNQKKFHCITNSFDVQKTNISAKKVRDKFIISYTGIFYPEKDPFTFFRALESWLAQLNNDEKRKIEKILEVRLIGSYTRAVANVIESLNLSKVFRFIKRVPHNEAIRLTKGSDLLLICAGIKGKTRPGWLPSKLFEYLGCQIPILAICREGEMARIIRNTKSGYVITSENHGLIHAILAKEIGKKMSGKNSTDFLFQGIEQFQESEVMSRFCALLDDVIHRH